MKPFVQTPVDIITRRDLKPIAKLIYQLLHHYNSPERGCFPGRKRLADDLDISEDTVDRSINSLCALGLIVKSRQGRGHNNRYYFPDDSASVPNQEPYESAPMRSQEDESAPLRVLESAPMRSPESAPMRSPIRTIPRKQYPEEQERLTPLPPRQPRYTETNPAPGFAEFYEAYPKKRDRADAVKAWNKIAPDEALRGEIIAAVKAQSRSFDWCKSDGQYIPLPSTWLNKRRWEDQITVTVSSINDTSSTLPRNARTHSDDEVVDWTGGGKYGRKVETT